MSSGVFTNSGVIGFAAHDLTVTQASPMLSTTRGLVGRGSSTLKSSMTSRCRRQRGMQMIYWSCWT
jgi:hypothetical protein